MGPVAIQAPAPHRAPLLAWLYTCVLVGSYVPVASWYVTYADPAGWTWAALLFYGYGLGSFVGFSSGYALDMWLYGGTAANLKVMAAVGLSKGYVVYAALTNFLVAMLPPAVFIAVFAPAAAPRFDAALVTRVLVALAATDVAFYAVHKLMHRHLPGLHTLHHACVFPSFTTNLLFDPLDLSLEFAGPLVVSTALLATELVPGMNDPFALVVTFTLIQVLYLGEHDQWVGSQHCAHHTRATTTYWIYPDFHFWKWGSKALAKRDADDKVRALIFDKINIVK
jgi:sterol desaturase/sphingolipid hydroxylase (fatty acid hydroxylase superfamily)